MTSAYGANLRIYKGQRSEEGGGQCRIECVALSSVTCDAVMV